MLSLDWIEEIFCILKKNYPNPQPFLIYNNNYTLLVAVLLSARCQDAQVNKVMHYLIPLADSPEKMIKVPLEVIENHISSLGLYKKKAVFLKKLSQMLVDQHEGKIPRDLDSLMKLPGVGRKTALVVMSIAFQAQTIPVDTHVFRVSKRIGFSQGKDVLQVEKDLEKVLPAIHKEFAHFLLISHGRKYCKAKNPLCFSCPLEKLCSFSTLQKKT